MVMKLQSITKQTGGLGQEDPIIGGHIGEDGTVVEVTAGMGIMAVVGVVLVLGVVAVTVATVVTVAVDVQEVLAAVMEAVVVANTL
jgi:hypothetical protein